MSKATHWLPTFGLQSDCNFLMEDANSEISVGYVFSGPNLPISWCFSHCKSCVESRAREHAFQLNAYSRVEILTSISIIVVSRRAAIPALA